MGSVTQTDISLTILLENNLKYGSRTTEMAIPFNPELLYVGIYLLKNLK